MAKARKPNMKPMTISNRDTSTSDARALLSRVAIAAKIRRGNPVSLSEIAKYSYGKKNPTPEFLGKLETQLEQPISIGYISQQDGLYVLTGKGHEQIYGREVFPGVMMSRGARNRMTQSNVGTNLALGKRDPNRKYGTI